MNVFVYRPPDRPSTPAHWMALFVLAIIFAGGCAATAFWYGFTTEATPANAAKLAELRWLGLVFSGVVGAVVAVWFACHRWLW